MSGSPGIESVPGPELPKLEFLERFNGTTNLLKSLRQKYFLSLSASRKMLS